MKAFAVAITLLVALCSASAQSVRAEIEASKKAIGKTMIAKDFKTMTKLVKAGVTPDFKYVEGKMTMKVDEMCQGMAMGLGAMKKITRADAKILTLKESGNTATATVSHTIEGTSEGPDKKMHTMGFGGTSQETYVKQGGKWKMSKMTWLNQKSTMDGKPMPMPQGG